MVEAQEALQDLLQLAQGEPRHDDEIGSRIWRT
jgi:hypothetical protein